MRLPGEEGGDEAVFSFREKSRRGIMDFTELLISLLHIFH